MGISHDGWNVHIQRSHDSKITLAKGSDGGGSKLPPLPACVAFHIRCDTGMLD